MSGRNRPIAPGEVVRDSNLRDYFNALSVNTEEKLEIVSSAMTANILADKLHDSQGKRNTLSSNQEALQNFQREQLENPSIKSKILADVTQMGILANTFSQATLSNPRELSNDIDRALESATANMTPAERSNYINGFLSYNQLTKDQNGIYAPSTNGAEHRGASGSYMPRAFTMD